MIPKYQKYPKENVLFLISMVGDAAMHILHDSYLNGSDLWPAGGFKVNSFGKNVKDCITYGVNAYGWEKNPMIGRLGFHVWNYDQCRVNEQFEHIKNIMDYTYYNDFLFEDELRRSCITDMLWFKFTYTPKD